MHDGRYWDAVYRDWRDARPHALWRRHSDAVDAEWLLRWLPAAPVPRLLKTDLFNEAIGPGLYSLLAPSARQVFGNDISVETTRAAQAHHPELRTLAADVRHLPYRDRTFDVVVSNSTLDHFEDDADIDVGLRESHRVLRAGGDLLLSLDNGMNPVIAVRNGFARRFLQRIGIVPYHVGPTLGHRGLTAALRRNGFEVLSVDSVLHCPRMLAVAGSGLVERTGNASWMITWLRVLSMFERLGRLPTRHLTAYMVIVRARRCRE